MYFLFIQKSGFLKYKTLGLTTMTKSSCIILLRNPVCCKYLSFLLYYTHCLNQFCGCGIYSNQSILSIFHSYFIAPISVKQLRGRGIYSTQRILQMWQEKLGHCESLSANTGVEEVEEARVKPAMIGDEGRRTKQNSPSLEQLQLPY